VAGLLSTQHIAVFQHVFQHVTVAYRRAFQTDIRLLEGDIQPHIAHDGRYAGVAHEKSLLL